MGARERKRRSIRAEREAPEGLGRRTSFFSSASLRFWRSSSSLRARNLRIESDWIAVRGSFLEAETWVLYRFTWTCARKYTVSGLKRLATRFELQSPLLWRIPRSSWPDPAGSQSPFPRSHLRDLLLARQALLERHIGPRPVS